MATYLATRRSAVQDRAVARRRARVGRRGRSPRAPGREAGAAAHRGRIMRFFRALFGPVSVRADVGAIVDRAGCRLRARDPDAPDLHERPRTSHPSPTSSPTSGSATASACERWQRHLAQRGLRDLGGVALGRGARRPDDGAAVRASSIAPASVEATIWDPPPRRTRGPQQLFANSVYERGGMTLEALRQRIGDDGLLRDLAAGPPSTPRQRDDRRVHRPRRGALRAGARRAVPALAVQAGQARRRPARPCASLHGRAPQVPRHLSCAASDSRGPGDRDRDRRGRRAGRRSRSAAAARPRGPAPSTSTASSPGSTSTTASCSSPRTSRVPLLERAKFAAIWESNLDEFFMVRVANLQDRSRPERRPAAPTGWLRTRCSPRSASA